MNQGQTKFYEYMMERMKEEYKDDAAKLMVESFVLQKEGKFTHVHMEQFQQKMMVYIKPAYCEEVLKVLHKFKDSIN